MSHLQTAAAAQNKDRNRTTEEGAGKTGHLAQQTARLHQVDGMTEV